MDPEIYHLRRNSLESGCEMRYGHWRKFENGEAIWTYDNWRTFAWRPGEMACVIYFWVGFKCVNGVRHMISYVCAFSLLGQRPHIDEEVYGLTRLCMIWAWCCIYRNAAELLCRFFNNNIVSWCFRDYSQKQYPQFDYCLVKLSKIDDYYRLTEGWVEMRLLDQRFVFISLIKELTTFIFPLFDSW